MDERMTKSPKHYTEGRKFEPKDVIRDWDLNFNLGNAVKYLARAGRKGDIVEDLKKAQQYIQFEIDALAAEGKQEKKQRAEKEPNNAYSVHPIIDDSGVRGYGSRDWSRKGCGFGCCYESLSFRSGKRLKGGVKDADHKGRI